MRCINAVSFGTVSNSMTKQSAVAAFLRHQQWARRGTSSVFGEMGLVHNCILSGILANLAKWGLVARNLSNIGIAGCCIGWFCAVLYSVANQSAVAAFL